MEYICIGNCINKQTSTLAKIVNYNSNKTGNNGTFVDTNNKLFLKEFVEIGEVRELKLA